MRGFGFRTDKGRAGDVCRPRRIADPDRWQWRLHTSRCAFSRRDSRDGLERCGVPADRVASFEADEMKKGCLVGLVTWAIAAGAYWYYIHTRFVPPLDWIVPVVAGLLMAIVFGNLPQGLGSATSAVRASPQAAFSGVIGGRPKDGEVVTVVGHIRA